MIIRYDDATHLDFAEPWLLTSQSLTDHAYEPQFDMPPVQGKLV